MLPAAGGSHGARMITARADHQFSRVAAIPKLGIALIQNEPDARAEASAGQLRIVMSLGLLSRGCRCFVACRQDHRLHQPPG